MNSIYVKRVKIDESTFKNNGESLIRRDGNEADQQPPKTALKKHESAFNEHRRRILFREPFKLWESNKRLASFNTSFLLNTVQPKRTVSLSQFGIQIAPNGTKFYAIWIDYNGTSKSIDVFITEQPRKDALVVPKTYTVKQSSLTSRTYIVKQRWRANFHQLNTSSHKIEIEINVFRNISSFDESIKEREEWEGSKVIDGEDEILVVCLADLLDLGYFGESEVTEVVEKGVGLAEKWPQVFIVADGGG
ncbi:putative L-type lectin-domain containing receptor kinase S.5 [Senna tora]|uniref:Putative L-type lectin-domain containing receptor kinase S.5 n=1 Tax=Senna tora TaxID=362788 RepID=A0A834X9C6_9FABA|nr:putative L-type lectin-domain containing receptor kinase S.5 [Senna tora]